jgi:hypothetical protein
MENFKVAESLNSPEFKTQSSHFSFSIGQEADVWRSIDCMTGNITQKHMIYIRNRVLPVYEISIGVKKLRQASYLRKEGISSRKVSARLEHCMRNNLNLNKNKLKLFAFVAYFEN